MGMHVARCCKHSTQQTEPQARSAACDRGKEVAASVREWRVNAVLARVAWCRNTHFSAGQPAGAAMRRVYETPSLTVYGPIADTTFQTPGAVKGCKVDCHFDKFGEMSANTAGS